MHQFFILMRWTVQSNRNQYGNKSFSIHLWLLLHHNKMLVFHVCPYSKSFMHISNVEENKYCITLHSTYYVRRQSEYNEHEKINRLWWKINLTCFISFFFFFAPSVMECDITGHQLNCSLWMEVDHWEDMNKFSFSCTEYMISISFKTINEI